MNHNDRFIKVTSAIGLVSISIFVMVLIFIGAEYGYRHYSDRYITKLSFISNITQDVHVAKPYVMFTSKPGYQLYGPSDLEEGRINALGYLGPLPSANKPKDEYRIFIVGGSAVFQSTPPFSVYLEHKFRNEGYNNVRVFNFSVLSSVSRQELTRILLDISGYQPDLIISYTGYNDLYDTGWDRRVNYPHRYILYETNPAAVLKVSDYKFLPIFALSSQFLRENFPNFIFDSLTEGIIPNTAPSRSTIRPLLAQAFFQNLKLSNAVSEALGADYIAFLQPTVFFKKNLTDAEKKIFTASDLATAIEIRNAVKSEAQKLPSNLKYFDLNDMFGDESRTIFTDFVHYVPDDWVGISIAGTLYSYLAKYIDFKKHHIAKVKDLIPEENFTFNPAPDKSIEEKLAEEKTKLLFRKYEYRNYTISKNVVITNTSMNLYSNDTASKNFVLSEGNTHKISIVGYGTKVGGIGPQIVVSIDGAEIGRIDFPEENPTEKVIYFSSDKKKVNVSFSFVNDVSNELTKEDRNFYFVSMEVDGK